MPIKVYVCTCGGSENTARQLLKASKVKDWLKTPIVKESAQFKALKALLSHKSRFVVFLGYSTAHQAVIWADVAGGRLSEKLDGQAIAEKYYNLP